VKVFVLTVEKDDPSGKQFTELAVRHTAEELKQMVCDLERVDPDRWTWGFVIVNGRFIEICWSGHDVYRITQHELPERIVP
jgi:hypothetical protein